MKRFLMVLLLGLTLVLGFLSGASTAPEVKKADLFKTSLHHTGRGMAYWYDKANDGLETATRVPYSKLACKKCHAVLCEACHKSPGKKPGPGESKGPTSQEMCLKCHDQLAETIKKTQATPLEDVHFAKGMACMDCHTQREMHGDGKPYNSLRQEGALDARCENCHKPLKPSTSHRKHSNKVHCLACHTGQMTHRLSYQFEPLAKEGKRVAKPASDWVFLLNFNQKLMSGKLEAFVLPGQKTHLLFSPYNSHVIMKKGRRCDECHGSKVMRELDKVEAIRLLASENDKGKKIPVLIPVTVAVDFELEYEKFENGKWVPLGLPEETATQVIGFGDFLTDKQIKKLKKDKNE
jgi:Cytochrome c3